MANKRILFGAVAVAAALSGGALVLADIRGHDAKATETATAAPSAIPVSVATVESREVVPWEEFSGRLEAVDKVEVRSRVSGQVQAVHFREGGLVKKGDLLVTIDPAPFAAEVARAEAQLASAQARLGFTKREYDRAQALTASGNMPVREADNRANAYFEAQANVRAASAAVDTARLNLGYTRVTAPVSGRVGKAEVTVGNLVPAGAGAPVLTTLVSVNPIYASFDASEQVVMRSIAGVRDGSGTLQVERIPVQMIAQSHGDAPVDGRVHMIGNAVDARSGTIEVRAVFDNADGSLMPGQFARLRMGQPKAESVVLVSERAVGTDQDKKFVLVVGDDNKAAYRNVVLGATVDGMRVVNAGLKPGERIIVGGLQRVRPGMPVAPQQAAMPGKGAELAQR
ncbi:MAG: efflux RND transporter periplasmic adaptor subunit [Bacteroidota bacterium]